MRTLQCRSQLYFVIPGVMTPLGLLLLLLPLLVTSIRQEDRVDCQPGEPGDSNICAARGCLWDQAGLERGVPWCYLPPEYGYVAEGEAEATAQGSRIHLTRNEVGRFPLFSSRLGSPCTVLDSPALPLKWRSRRRAGSGFESTLRGKNVGEFQSQSMELELLPETHCTMFSSPMIRCLVSR